MCIAWSQEEGSPQIVGDGFPADTSSFSLSKYSVWFFAGSFSLLSNVPSKNTSLLSPANWLLCSLFRRLLLCCAPQLNPTGSSTLSDPLPAPSASLDLPCALYPPHCHRQLPTRFDDRWQSQLPVARLRHGHRTRTMTLDAHEFLRRFLLHVLPAGFGRIRYFGLLANRHRNLALNLCRQYWKACPCRRTTPEATPAWLSSVNTAVGALCGCLRFSLRRDLLSGCPPHLKRRIPHDGNFVSPALSTLL